MNSESRPAKEGVVVQCPYCSSAAKRVTGREVYPHRPDLFGKQFYRCAPCDATVGCHPDGKPLGRLANADLRREKMATHASFDPLWQKAQRMYDRPSGKTRNIARLRAYEWLADMMGIPVDQCHIGMFSEQQCRSARAVILDAKPTPESIRAWAKQRRAA